jgi:Mg2+ and Co2+ transporter CorA
MLSLGNHLIGGKEGVSHPAVVKFIFALFLAVFGAILLTGCQTTSVDSQIPVRAKADHQVPPSSRNNGYSLLHQLLDEQKDVSKLRFIKREPSDLKELINQIAAASRAGARQLELYAQQDASLVLTDYRLPPAELAARKAMATTKQNELLHESDDPFELSLFLAQTEALSYASHLAKVTAAFEPQSDRAKYLTQLSEQMDRLHRQLLAWMLSRMHAGVQSQGTFPGNPK